MYKKKNTNKKLQRKKINRIKKSLVLDRAGIRLSIGFKILVVEKRDMNEDELEV